MADALPAKVSRKRVKLELHLPAGDALLLKQIAEILRHSRSDALELEKVTQDILNRSKFQMPKDECAALVHDLLR